MSQKPILTVYAARAERLRGTVHLHFRTEQGEAILRFTRADADEIGTALRQAALDPTPETHIAFRAPPLPHVAAAAAGLPLRKPGGGI